MASVVLTAAGSSIGGAYAGSIGAMIGSQLGGYIGSQIDNAIFGVPTKTIEGARLEDLSVQTSTYGKMIPKLYGSVRTAGNIIWSRPIKETKHSQSQGGGKAGGSPKVTQNTYTYSVSLAIAICEGEITDITRVWADAKQLQLGAGTYRLYKGTETQLPDTFIEGFEGVENVPAYRGMAYVVIEDFPLADYGNRIPNFTFEINKKHLQPEETGKSLEEMITAMTLIPGAGEFVYDTTTQYKVAGTEVFGQFYQSGAKTPINQHNHSAKANALVSLDNLADTCPNLEWVSVVVTWFGDSLDIASCEIFPAVEYKEGAIVQPDTWAVGSYTRDTAQQITIIDGTPRYGGTPSDSSLENLLTELKSRGYKVMLYPMMFMDIEGKDWRGHLTGATGDVASFFTNEYNPFITHYADMVASLNSTKQTVDAFIIGSEMIGLTSITDGVGGFPAVSQFVSLAATVKTTVGSGVKVSYAADWSEYHHTNGGWYNLDPLWASSNIDFVGIDAYFPLTNAPQSSISLQDAIDGWTSGEGYDFYYTDGERTSTASLSPEWAWKNIEWWWENTHTNPDTNQTAWVAESKPIWFTEYGFPSVDGATNQPNVFYDPNSDDGGFPYHSKGIVDLSAQRMGLTATELVWENSTMIENKFVWSWDARPYPFYPDLETVWADGDLWQYGHWVTGKLGISSLAAVVADLCEQAGLTEYDVSDLDGLIYGYIVAQRNSVRGNIENLMRAYFFDAVERDGLITFVGRGRSSVATITEGELLQNDDGKALTITRTQEIELPYKIDVLYLDKMRNYQTGTQTSIRQNATTQEVITLNIPLVLSRGQAKSVSDISLYNSWVGRTKYSFSLPIKYAELEPTDVITVDEHIMRLTSVHQGLQGELRCEALAEDISVYQMNPYEDIQGESEEIQEVGETALEFLDIPLLPTDEEAYIRFAMDGLAEGWQGSVLYYSLDDGSSYNPLVSEYDGCIMGTAIEELGADSCCVMDTETTLDVLITGDGELESVTELALLNGANLAVVGDEVLQFMTATFVSEGKYRLSGFLRGRLGTEWAVSEHAVGDRFVLINGNVGNAKGQIGLSVAYKPVSVGDTLGNITAESYTYTGEALRPYAPVHIEQVKESGGDIALSWVRRTRVNGDWRDYADVPLGEESELYEVDILDGSDVVRTISCSSSSATYTVSQQTEDFGSGQTSVVFEVYQMSSVVGRGHAG